MIKDFTISDKVNDYLSQIKKGTLLKPLSSLSPSKKKASTPQKKSKGNKKRSPNMAYRSFTHDMLENPQNPEYYSTHSSNSKHQNQELLSPKSTILNSIQWRSDQKGRITTSQSKRSFKNSKKNYKDIVKKLDTIYERDKNISKTMKKMKKKIDRVGVAKSYKQDPDSSYRYQKNIGDKKNSMIMARNSNSKEDLKTLKIDMMKLKLDFYKERIERKDQELKFVRKSQNHNLS